MSKNEKKKLTPEQLYSIIIMENSYPMINWQDIAVMEGWEQLMKVWEFWKLNIESYINEY